MMYYNYTFPFFGILWPIIWLVVAFVIIIPIIRFTRGGGRRFRRRDSALDVLRDRYARGEINKQEFEEKKKDLE